MATVVLGAQWGDEGKGKLVDVLSSVSDVVCRCAGGNNAGHTVKVADVSYDFHLLPSGILNTKATCVIGNGVVVHVPDLLKEIAKNEAKGLTGIKDRLIISDRAHLVFDMHQQIDGLIEAEKGKDSLGTTRKGIGPTYSAKAARIGIRVCDLIGNFDGFEKKFRTLVAEYHKRFPTLQVDIDAELANYKALAEVIRPCVRDTILFVNDAIKHKQSVLVEGANAALLDIDFGTYPYVTSSNCSVGGVSAGLGIAPKHIGPVYGVVKAYTTRVGDGAFPTELLDETGKALQETGREWGVTTGRRRRCGWLDLVVLAYSNLLNAYDAICLTKLDVFDAFSELKIAVAYYHHGKKLQSFPSDLSILAEVAVEYITLPGWQTPIHAARSFAELPAQAQAYVRKVEEISGIPVKWIGVGAARDDIITLF